MTEKGELIIVSAPAGTGKTTLIDMLKKEYPQEVVQSVSCTTRKPRLGEVDGRDYVFLTDETFDKRVQKGDFLEHAVVFGHHYGTPKDLVKAQLANGKRVILVIDTQGAMKIKEKTHAVYIFIAPPSIDSLEERLKNRKTESSETLKKRLKWAQHEMDQARHYDYVIVNDDLETAYLALKNIIMGKKRK